MTSVAQTPESVLPPVDNTMISSCGIHMAICRDGDIPQEYHHLIDCDLRSLEGTWVEMKKLCQSADTILQKAGVGFIKRKALGASTLRTEICVKDIDQKGNPTMYFKTYYPLGITKDTTFPTDGRVIPQPDSDTCDWKCLGLWCNGRLIQKREGAKGTMYDARAVLKRHPTGATDESPILCFVWTLIDTEGKKHVAEHFMKKVA